MRQPKRCPRAGRICTQMRPALLLLRRGQYGRAIARLSHPLSLRVRLARLFVSWIGVAIGVPLLIRAELGVAPFDVFNTGVSSVSGWSFGTCFIVDALGCFVIGKLLGAPIGWASVAGNFVIGPLVDVVLRVVPDYDRMIVRVPLLAAGILVIATAICLVVSTELGSGPTEVLMLGLMHHRLGVIPARWLSDGVPMVIGVIIGGSLGVGTLVFVLAMGPLVKFGLRRLRYEPVRARVAVGT